LFYKDAHIKTILKRFAEEKLSHVEIFNILYMFKLENENRNRENISIGDTRIF
jgi:hypothetical protein